MGRILALDYGTKRIGVALTDETKTIAIPKPSFAAKQFKNLIDYIKANQVEKILLGLPKNLKGEETRSAKAARNFGLWLQAETQLPVEYIDERFTTREAKTRFGSISSSQIDSLAAYIILELYLKKYVKNHSPR